MMTIKDLLDELHERETKEGGVGIRNGWEDWHVVGDINDLFESSVGEGGCQEDTGECSSLMMHGLPDVKHVHTLM